MQSASFHSPLAVALPRVALLIDGDNIPWSEFAGLRALAATFGTVTALHVFCDVSRRADWSGETACTTHHAPGGAGRNRADLHLAVTALDLAHRRLADAFLIASDDQDFLPLVAALREMGLRVEVRGKTVAAPPPRPGAGMAPPPSELDKRLRIEITAEKALSGVVTLARLGEIMKGDPVKARTGKASWSSYLKSRPDLYVVGLAGKTAVVALAP